MTITDSEVRQAPDVRRAGQVGLLGSLATLVSGVVVAAVIQPRSDISDDQFSFPWSPDALVPVSLTYAVFHVMVAVGVYGIIRSALFGSSRAARFGQWLAVLGSVLLAVAEVASIAVRDSLVDDADALWVGAVFGVASLLSLVGFLIVGVTTLRAGRWPGPGRYAPLAVGLSLVALMVLIATPALAVGVGIYGLSLVALFATFLKVDLD